MTWLDYTELPSDNSAFSSLFLDYIRDYSTVQQYYNGNYRDDADWKRCLERVSARTIDRSAIVQILSTQNRNFHCGVRTLANIDLLLNDNTVAIVTGQQVGLFTGPLYTIYKTLTVLKLVEKLGAKFPDYHFVPVFWLEGEDHDYEEVNSIQFINTSNDLVKLDYQLKGKDPGKNLGAVGTLEFDENIEQFFSSLDGSLMQTEFKPKVLQLFKTAYQKGMTFNKAFVHLMNDLLDDSGLIFLDPNDPEVKKLLIPVFKKDLEETPKLCKLVIDQSAELEKTYHAQIKPKTLNSFLFHEGGRYLLEPKENGYALKGTRKTLPKEYLQDVLSNSPHLLSPNVVLRPLCQDTLLPTAAYVAGPSEIAYFAQLKPLYQEFGIPEPIIYPRASITIVEEKVEKVLTRFHIELTDVLRDTELIKQRIADEISDVKVDELFANTFQAIENSLGSMKEGIQTIDPTLLGALDNAKSKMRGALDGLKEKSIAAQKRRHEVSLRQVDKAALFVYPGGNFQERTLNGVYFLNKYGLEFVKWLYGEMSIEKFKHQVISL
ncbi:MAG: bacillithiol biosynthesis cysteine-adding enzyme BshC [Ignavibacteriae bacterium]|nr:bacillithiol biosynthesis cysteine-adding enzyme BshC [Ignavibacteriota bacterium]